MPTILHISDLHRTPHPRLDNDELLSSISSDASRWHGDGIPPPDLIVVSGDVVQGANIDDPNADAVLKAQRQTCWLVSLTNSLTQIVHVS